jgi:hypothetical protein
LNAKLIADNSVGINFPFRIGDGSIDTISNNNSGSLPWVRQLDCRATTPQKPSQYYFFRYRNIALINLFEKRSLVFLIYQEIASFKEISFAEG